MKAMRAGDSGAAVRRWQVFLIGQGFPLTADGEFGPKTHDATAAFQRQHQLATDGVAGNQTLGKAMLLGFSVVPDPADTSKTGPNWPPPPDFPAIRGTVARQRAFGTFEFRAAPTPDNPEAIVILGTWESENIVRVPLPQLASVQGAPANNIIRFHRIAAPSLTALWQAWQQAGLLPLVLTWDGSFVPRFIRGSQTELSNHAFGTAFDINARWNPLGAAPPRVGMAGSVRELVQIANQHGFYWGGHFKNRPDGMHFEYARS